MSSSFVLTDVQVLGSDTAILLSTRDYHAWSSDGKKGERLGTAYSVLATGGDPCIVQVKVVDEKSVVNLDMLKIRNANAGTGENFTRVKFSGFQARTYTNKAGKMALACRALRAELVDEDEVLIE